jgi:trans-aconitate 2-methyltransferase
MASYAFGDSDIAAERLELLADTFELVSREFLRAAAPSEPGLALDLGCGTGRTTVLIAEVTGAGRTVGIDNSDAFLSRAGEHARPGIEFAQYDVTVVPFRDAPADLIYARYMLAHLADPEAHLRAWAEQLRPGGRLLLDENEYIATDHPTLSRYEQLVTEVLAARRASMHVGPRIGRADPGGAFRRCHDEVVPWPVPEPIAARLYALNLATWRGDDYVTRTYRNSTIDALADDLGVIAASRSETPVEFGIRQVAFERRS